MNAQRKQRRVRGRLIRWTESKSGGHGLIGHRNTAVFVHRTSILSGDPVIGRTCEFTKLPPNAQRGELARAVECDILAPQRREDPDDSTAAVRAVLAGKKP